MRWTKRGLIYSPSGELWWARSHAYLPTAELLNDKTIRVYFSSLDESLYGRIGYIDLDANDPSKIQTYTKEPILGLGETGTFDDCGVNASSIITVSGKKYLFYNGWQRTERVPYMIFTGLAISDDGKSFYRKSSCPVLDRTNDEPFIRSAPTIISENGTYRMWYVCAEKWSHIEGERFSGNLYPVYRIRTASSLDAISWKADNKISIDFQNVDEFGFGRPWVIKDGNIYKMWYSVRTKSMPYYIGYAESFDGYLWNRKDNQAGITFSESGWDSEMICFPSIIDVKGKRYMFYNGNQHGKTGFGFAELEKD